MAASAGCAPSRATRAPAARGGAARRRPRHPVRCRRRPAAPATAASMPLAPPLDRIHRELKREFDPAGIFNRGRLYPISDQRPAMQTHLAPEFNGHARRPGGRGHPAQVRALRLLHRHLPHLPDPGRRARRPARAHLPDQAGAGRRRSPPRKTQLHLDRCLTCRNCESTCPSGVEYGHLVDIGRKIVEQQGAARRRRAGAALDAEGRADLAAVRPGDEAGPDACAALLPRALQGQGAGRGRMPGRWPTRAHARKVLMLAGCVQPSMMPNINSATARVLDAAGIQTVVAAQAGCCGAVKFHLNDQEGGLAQMRANIDAWWPLRGERRGRGDRDERLRLRRHGARVRPSPAARPGLCGQGRGASASSRAT